MEKKGETGCCDWTLLPPSLLPLSCGPSSRFPFGPALTHGVVLSLVCSGFFSFLPLHFSFCPQRRLSMEREHFTHIPPVPLCHGLPSHPHGQGQTCRHTHTHTHTHTVKETGCCLCGRSWLLVETKESGMSPKPYFPWFLPHTASHSGATPVTLALTGCLSRGCQ